MLNPPGSATGVEALVHIMTIALALPAGDGDQIDATP